MLPELFCPYNAAKGVFVHVDSGFELLNLQWPRSQF